MGLPKEIADFMARYGVLADEIWQVRSGGNAYAIKHKALERIAAREKIVFDRPAMLEGDSKEKVVAICVFGQMGDRSEWSIGEAAPGNNKNAYPWAMAEKRGKDRVILKLLQAHGDIYSEDEAEDFKASAPATTLPKKDSRHIYEKMQAEIRECNSRDHLKAWMQGNVDRIKVLPEDWQDILRLQCEEMMADLRQREAA